MTARETCLAALQAAIGTACAALTPAPIVAARNETLADTLEAAISDPAAIRVALSDGEPADPVALLGDPPQWDHGQTAQISIAAAHPDPATRDAAVDTVAAAIAAALDANTTLAGTCDAAVPLPPQDANTGDMPNASARILAMPVSILFTSNSSIG